MAVGEVAALKELLAAEDVDVDEKDEEGRTALQVQGPTLPKLMPLHQHSNDLAWLCDLHPARHELRAALQA